MRDIAILGSGLAGFHAARRLEQKLSGRRRVRLTVVTRRPRFVFTPLLAAVATGELEPDHITALLREALDERTRIVVRDVQAIDVGEGRLETTGEPVSFDYLLVATGSIRDPEAFDGADTLAGPDNIDDATTIRDRIAELCEDGSRLRFGVVGATAAGIEFAGQLATHLTVEYDQSVLGDDIEISVYEARDRILPDHSRQLAEEVGDGLRQLGVDIQTGRRVTEATPTSVRLADGTSISTSLTVHCASRRGVPLVRDTELPTDAADRISVQHDLGVRTRPTVFAAGDAAAPPDLPAVRYDPHLARQQGQCAARNLVATMSGRTRQPFEFEDRGHFITLGPDHTVLELAGVQLKGRAAWLAYRLYYTALMPRPIRKVRLLRDWIAGRLTTRTMKLPDDED